MPTPVEAGKNRHGRMVMCQPYPIRTHMDPTLGHNETPVEITLRKVKLRKRAKHVPTAVKVKNGGLRKFPHAHMLQYKR